MNKKFSVKDLTLLAVFTALSFVITLLSKLIPPVFSAVPFLTLDFKDAFVVILGFMTNPLYCLIVTVIEALVEMITISSTGLIGLIMNIISTGTFSVVASAIYKKVRKMKGAVFGLVIGAVISVVVMLLWNYLITPLYMGVERQMVASLILPGILPFNVLKYVLNCALAVLLYKRFVVVLSKAKLLPENRGQTVNKKNSVLSASISVFIIAMCILSILVVMGKI